MPLLLPQQYVQNRQAYNYADDRASFTILPTGTLPFNYVGAFRGIFPGRVPATYPTGITLRRFEAMVQAIFLDASTAANCDATTAAHIENLRTVALAVVHWKMASQRDRAPRNVANVNDRWRAHTHDALLLAYQHRSLCEFMIDGVRVATASAFLRFLYPDHFGIVDRRVVERTNQPNGITTFNLRNDGYIVDVRENIDKYVTEYVPFLRNEAASLNAEGFSFIDTDANGAAMQSVFRPCDVEMALF